MHYTRPWYIASGQIVRTAPKFYSLAIACRVAMERANRHTDALQLPIEVWNKVFACLKPKCKMFGGSKVDDVTEQAQLHQLRLVCTKFNKVVEQHPELLDQLLLPGYMSWQSWPSLLRWLQRYRSHVRSVLAPCNADSQALLLGALACPSSQLTEVCLAESGMLHIHALSVFTTIKQCSLSNPKGSDLDLKPLQGLHSLQDMFLQQGQYSNVPLSSHLTRLHVEDSTASCVELACCTPGLEDLTVYNATLSALHGDGLISCSGLTSLDVLNCSNSGSHEGAHFSVGTDHLLCIPPNISSLTQLRHLRVAMEISGNVLDVSWTYGLTSLYSLELKLEGAVTISHDLTQLQQLTMLTVAVEPWYESDTCPYSTARFEVSWKAMYSLQHIVLSGHMTLLDNVQEISLLKEVSLVSITEFQPGDDKTAVYLARLAYNLAAHKPHVQFTVESPVDLEVSMVFSS